MTKEYYVDVKKNEDHDLFIKSEFGKLSIGSNNRKDLSNVVCDDISFSGFSPQMSEIRDSFIRSHIDDIQIILKM